MNITDSFIFIIFLVSLFTYIIAVRLGRELYK